MAPFFNLTVPLLRTSVIDLRLAYALYRVGRYIFLIWPLYFNSTVTLLRALLSSNDLRRPLAVLGGLLV